MKVIKYLIILNYAIRIRISMKLYVACILHNSEIPSLLYIKSVRLTDKLWWIYVYMYYYNNYFFFLIIMIIPGSTV